MSQLPLVLTIVDTAAIQQYVFGSNQLRHSVGASYLVHWATHDAVIEALRPPEMGRSNVKADGTIDPALWIERGDVDCELVYMGGGNAVLLFREPRLAVTFTRALTTRILDQAPGLGIVVTHVDMRWDLVHSAANDSLAQKVQAAIQAVNRKKMERSATSSPLLGLSVTATCQYTGLPASYDLKEQPDREYLRVSAEVAAKTDSQVVKAANQRLRTMVGDALPAEWDFVFDFEQLGVKNEFSFLAVVHADGNGMGERVKHIAQRWSEPDQNRAYIAAMRAFSESIEAAAQKALHATVRDLVGAIQSGKLDKKVQVHAQTLPFRPIVFGGDDITFVCDGRLGLSLCERYLHLLQQEVLDDKKQLYVRAGIALVKTHYPFAAAYGLAEELAAEAKVIIREQAKLGRGAEHSALDWHFGVTGIVDDIERIRVREFTLPKPGEGKLHMRPILLGDCTGEWRTWNNFRQIAAAFGNPTGRWAGKRSKLKLLREALRRGPDVVRQFLAVYEPDASLPALGGNPAEASKTGWDSTERCICFDAIEALDFYVELPQLEAKE